MNHKDATKTLDQLRASIKLAQKVEEKLSKAAESPRFKPGNVLVVVAGNGSISEELRFVVDGGVVNAEGCERGSVESTNIDSGKDLYRLATDDDIKAADTPIIIRKLSWLLYAS